MNPWTVCPCSVSRTRLNTTNAVPVDLSLDEIPGNSFRQTTFYSKFLAPPYADKQMDPQNATLSSSGCPACATERV